MNNYQNESKPYVTYILVALNIFIYILTVVAESRSLSPSIEVLVAFGGNIRELTFNGAEWRMLTYAFLHGSISHIIFNMYALLSFGSVVEGLFGSFLFFIIYMVSGACGGLFSVIIHESVVSVGASGAVFGACGALIAYMLVNKKKAFSALRTSTLAFVGYNIVFGLFDPTIDNACHFGGLVGGILAGNACASFATHPVRIQHSINSSNKFSPPEDEIKALSSCENLERFPAQASLTEPVMSLIRLAEAGDADAQSKLGYIYEFGQGVSRNYAEAVKWYEKSAAQDDPYGQLRLYHMYSLGHGVPQDFVTATNWLRRSAEQGDSSAQYELGCLYIKGEWVARSSTEAVQWISKSAEGGNSSAQYALGCLYANGEGVVQNDAEAIKWLNKSAERGDLDAQFTLGFCYLNGKSVTQDYSEALKWYRKSAKAGNAEARSTLGHLYLSGRGVVRDKIIALTWFILAIEAAPGNPKHQKCRNTLLEKMTDSEKRDAIYEARMYNQSHS